VIVWPLCCLVGGLVSIWADDLLLSPENWETPSARLLESLSGQRRPYIFRRLDARVRR